MAGYDDDDSSPVRSALKPRPMSTAKSLENLGACTGKRRPVFDYVTQKLVLKQSCYIAAATLCFCSVCISVSLMHSIIDFAGPYAIHFNVQTHFNIMLFC